MFFPSDKNPFINLLIFLHFSLHFPINVIEWEFYRVTDWTVCFRPDLLYPNPEMGDILLSTQK